MDARTWSSVLSLASFFFFSLSGSGLAQVGRQQPFAAGSENFIVFASSPQWAAQVAEMAELNRRNLALHWLGKELPQWSERIPIHVEAGEHLGAGGETRFSLLGNNRVGQWMMIVTGTQERILDSVLPHEITHTIFATHFAHLEKYVPRWADEGACTTVEHISEKKKHQDHLVQFLKTRRGLPFNKMFSLKDYPPDIMPLYAQGHSAVQFLIDQGGPQKFVKFLETGMRSEAWPDALRQHYAYESVGQFQTMWNQWLADGSPQDLLAYAPGLRANGGGENSSTLALAVNVTGATGLDMAAASADSTTVSLASVRPAASQLASNSIAQNSVTASLNNESWYKRRLREVSGEAEMISQQAATPAIAPTSAAEGAHVAPPVVPPIPEQSVGHGPQMQSAGIQVLDWGASGPIPGIEPNARHAATAPNMVPIYR